MIISLFRNFRIKIHHKTKTDILERCRSWSLEYEWSEAHATGRCDGRQEGRESGYYNLHRNLNDPLLHNCPLSIFNYQLRSISLYRGLLLRRRLHR